MIMYNDDHVIERSSSSSTTKLSVSALVVVILTFIYKLRHFLATWSINDCF